MCGEHERFWWPLELSECEERAVASARSSLRGYARVHDRALSARAASLLADRMSHCVLEIEDRDTLPNLCHVINGWGNAPLASGSVLDGYARYVHRSEDGSPTFALVDEVRTLQQLVEMAIEAHYDGHFRVCRKVHLTEGLCAISALDPAFAAHRQTAQDFLDGQLDLLPVLWAALLGAREARERGQSVEPGSLVHQLRESLVIEGFLENHYYLAGHLVELLTLAHGFGFEVSELNWAAARAVVDELNRLLPEYLPQVFFPACFLHFGHYRRAITLLDQLADGIGLDPAGRARFTADFRTAHRNVSGAPPVGDGVFSFGKSDIPMRDALAQAVVAYRAIAPADLGPRGNGAHFRRVLVPGWPRWLHFEIFDYASGVDATRTQGLGVELHLENPRHPGLFEVVQQIATQLGKSTRLRDCELDPDWWGGSGRLRAAFDDRASPETVALALRELIEVASPILNAALAEQNLAAASHAH